MPVFEANSSRLPEDVIVKRSPRVPESTGRVLDAIAGEEKRVIFFTNWLLEALRLSAEILPRGRRKLARCSRFGAIRKKSAAVQLSKCSARKKH